MMRILTFSNFQCFLIDLFGMGPPACSVRKQSNTLTAFLPCTSGPLYLAIWIEG